MKSYGMKRLAGPELAGANLQRQSTGHGPFQLLEMIPGFSEHIVSTFIVDRDQQMIKGFMSNDDQILWTASGKNKNNDKSLIALGAERCCSLNALPLPLSKPSSPKQGVKAWLA